MAYSRVTVRVFGSVSRMFRTCANHNCKRGSGDLPKQFESEKEWGLYCCNKCGDAVRRLRHYYKGKAAGEAPTVYEYGPFRFSVGLKHEGWINLSVEGGFGRTSFWIFDTGLPVNQMIIDVIHGLHDAYLNPDGFIEKAGEDKNRRREAGNLIQAARAIGVSIVEASRLI